MIFFLILEIALKSMDFQVKKLTLRRLLHLSPVEQERPENTETIFQSGLKKKKEKRNQEGTTAYIL